VKSLRDIPITRKLTIISMLTSCVALLVACGAIIGLQLVDFRKNMLERVLMTASIIGDNSAAALTFEDPAAAELTLKSLTANPNVVAAFIYDAEGHAFARYRAAGLPLLDPPPVLRNSHRYTDDWNELFQDRFANDYLEVFRDINVAGEMIGTVYLRHDMTELRSKLSRSFSVAMFVLLLAALVALFMTRKLLPLFAGPILDLGRIVREVAAHKDFSIRAVKQSDDEVGRLIDGFNEMLGEIQKRDSALQAAHESLEQRVEDRTEELASSLSVLNATLESTADGILALSQSGAVLSYNSKFASMWGIPPEMLQKRDGNEWLAFASSQVVNPERFYRKTGFQVTVPAKHAFDVIKLKDGRNFERYVQFQQIGEMTAGRVINYRDVTLRKRAEAELAETARQLQETSRRAGMAEVATSVLHNVGNVLNSVNISCSVVADRVRKSRVASVAKTAALLNHHADGLAEFLTADPTGQKLPGYLAKLAEHLASEQDEVLCELRLLTANIDHIKEIVAMQQNHAKVSGVTESINVTELVEDGLRMNEGSLAKHQVEIARDYSPVPLIKIEKHKVLQILINLIRNAKHACEDSERPDKQIIVRVTSGPDFVRIAFIDNGVGIPPGNLTRIFAHGFTTKAHGHGFGLHSGALAAREMGGTLTVASDGAGSGATFTLKLPIQQSHG
jgi:PAS domain S-box-containing protein